MSNYRPIIVIQLLVVYLTFVTIISINKNESLSIFFFIINNFFLCHSDECNVTIRNLMTSDVVVLFWGEIWPINSFVNSKDLALDTRLVKSHTCTVNSRLDHEVFCLSTLLAVETVFYFFLTFHISCFCLNIVNLHWMLLFSTWMDKWGMCMCE